MTEHKQRIDSSLEWNYSSLLVKYSMNQLVETDKAEIMSAVDTVGDKGKHVSVNAHNKFTEFSNFFVLITIIVPK